MKIVLKYILTNMQERKIRTAVMLLSVILSTTLLFVSLVIGDSYAAAQKKMARGMAGAATISITAKAGINGEPVYLGIDTVPGISSVKNKIGIVESPALYSENGYFENFDLLAADLQELDKINKPRLLNGSELTNFTGYKIVLPEKFTSKYKIKTGAPITLKIGGKPVTFEVAAIAAYDTVFLRNTRGFNGLVPPETLQEMLGIKDGYSQIMIVPAVGVKTASLKAELSSRLPYEQYRVNTIVDEAQVKAGARQKSMPFFLISFFSLTMSVFIIYSSYKVITLERLPIIGTFRSIGATEKMVTRILILESVLYGAIGGIVGIPVGFWVLEIILGGLSESLAQGIAIPMVISPFNIIICCTTAIAVSVLSAYVPVLRASKLPVKDVVLGTVEEKKASSSAKLIFGMILFVLSAILPYLFNGKLLYPAGGFSLLGLIVATIIVIPLVTSFASTLLERIYGIFLGNVGRLAARNMRENKNINQNITLLFISISAVIVISVVSSFVMAYIGDVFRDAQLDGFVDADMTPEFVEKIEKIDGIDKLLPIHVVINKIYGNDVIFSRVEAINDLPLYLSMFGMKFEGKTIGFDAGRNILLSDDYLKSHGLQTGNKIDLSNGYKSYEYKITGSFKSRANNAQAVISSEYARNDFGASNYGMIVYTSDAPEAVMILIRDLFGNKTNWSRTVEEFNLDAIGTVGAFLEPISGMTWFVLLLATIGIINNLLINYIQKRRSIAMYKSVGLSNSQNIKITLIESFTSGFIGAAIGIVVSYMEIRTIFLVAGPRISMKPEFDIWVFIMAGVIGIAVTLTGSLVPILKGSKMKIVEEIKFE